MWTGPPQFLFAPGGWAVHRRPAGPFTFLDLVCDTVSGFVLTRLRERLELRLNIGWFRLSQGTWNGPDPGPCEVFTIDLHRPSANVSGRYRGRHGFAIGLYHGKAVAFQFLPSALDGRNFAFGPAPIDQVIVYGLNAQEVRCCVSGRPQIDHLALIAKLQLPLREFMPELVDENAEFAEAKARLAPGESIDQQRFKELANILRVALRGPGRRPIDNLLRMQGESEEPEQMFALDPLRTLIASPKWRRVMGLGWLDRDPALVQGASFDYTITGLFPLLDANSRVFGFHTIPPATVLPLDFSLGDCRFRLSSPATVEAAPSIPPSTLQWVTRCGILIRKRTSLPWFGAGIDDFSACIDLPSPVKRIILELDVGHDLKFVGGTPGGPFTPVKPVPDGTGPLLEFSTPITQLNLLGKGFLFAVRIPSDDPDRLIPFWTVLPAVRFEETPRPEAPHDVEISNLQSAATMSTSANSIRKLHPLGMNIRWRATPPLGVPFWPMGLQVPPPLDATMFQAERHIEPDGPFVPVLAGDDNAMFGSREEHVPDETVQPGMDLMKLFPEETRPVAGSDHFSYMDVFRVPDEENPTRRDPPPPSSVLRYRMRTLDVIGRPSLNWRDSNTERLEKHNPPPPPSAYDPVPADELTKPGPTGVYTRVLVRGAQDLTPEETVLLGAWENVILLRWGWHKSERSQDPFATQFRVYISPTFDVLPGEILSVVEVPDSDGDWQLAVRVDQPLPAEAASGLFLNAGYPFFIVSQSDGPVMNMIVRTRIPDASGSFRKPNLGPVSVPLKLSPRMTRPQAWSERFIFNTGHAFMPITEATQYQAVIPGRLLLTNEHPRDAIWVGVTSADSEPYVPDPFFSPGPEGPLPGNESPVVAVLCEARRVVRPEFNPPPPAGPVPRVIAPEPAGGPVRFRLDLTPFLTGSGLATGQLVQFERTSVSALFAALKVSGNQLLATVVNRRDPGEADIPVTLPNPDDHASVIAAVEAGVNSALEDRLAVRLASIHPYADRLFQLATPAAVAFAPFDETLAPTEDRHIYRVRRADSAQRLSVSAAFVNAIVRVPSLTPGPSAQRAPGESNDPPQRLRLRIPPDPRLSHVLTFEHAVVEAPTAGEAELLRVPNRTDLAPGTSIRLRLPNGAVLTPSVQSLGAPPDPLEGWAISVDGNGPAGREVMVWASTITNDGIPSPVNGPWRVKMPKPPLAPPVLQMSASPATLDFSWSLPDPLITFAWLEVSTDGVLWERASPSLQRHKLAWSIRRVSASRQFRLIGSAQDGRKAISNLIEG